MGGWQKGLQYSVLPSFNLLKRIAKHNTKSSQNNQLFQRTSAKLCCTYAANLHRKTKDKKSC
jgi:hypothetical protein